MKISIITPMYNSGSYIRRMIQSVKALQFNHSQIDFILIDNGSSDNSIEIAKSENIQVIEMPNATISKMRNYGAFQSNGDIICFVDSDCLVENNWASIIVEIFLKEPEIGILGAYYDLGDNPNWIENTWNALKKDISGEVSFLSAGNMAIKRGLFEKINGFDESLETGEDWDICQRVINKGYQVICEPRLKVKHLGNIKSLKTIILKERWYGQGMYDVLKGRKYSKPLLISVSFIFLFLLMFVSLITGKFQIVFLLFLCLILLLLAVSLYFTRHVTSQRIKYTFFMIPISFCYSLGRSLAIFDIFFKLKNR